MAMNRWRVLGGASIGLGSLLAIVAACGPGDLSGLTAGLRSLDAGNVVLPSDASSCVKAGPPPPPVNASNDGGEASDLTFAVDDVRIDANSAGGSALSVPAGIDLDKSCTCYPDKPTCLPVNGGTAPCDGDGGIDDVTAPLLGQLADLIPALKPTTLKQNIDEGFYSMIFDVIEWNQTPDDPQVLVTVRMSTGTGNDQSGTRLTPNFDGNDVWDIDPNSIVGTPEGTQCAPGICTAGAVSTTGYVTNNTLVATFNSDIKVSFSVSGNGTITIPYRGVTLTAAISKDANGNFKLNGELDGRWPADSVLAAAGALGSVAGSTFPVAAALCSTDPTNQATYIGFKTEVCNAADLAVQPSQDGKGTTCGALSESMRFDAVKANVGVVKASTTTTTACGNHAGDSCSTH